MTFVSTTCSSVFFNWNRDATQSQRLEDGGRAGQSKGRGGRGCRFYRTQVVQS